MSDPVSNIDIEDVLTSIRRLVREGGAESGQKPLLMGPGSDRAGPAQADVTLPARSSAVVASDAHPSAPQPYAQQPNPPQPDMTRADSVKLPARFVLTPALRVADAPRAPALRVATAPAPFPTSPPNLRLADAQRPSADRPSSNGFQPLADNVPLPQDILAHMDVLRALADHSNLPLDGFDFASVLGRPSDTATGNQPHHPDDAPATSAAPPEPEPDQTSPTQTSLTQTRLAQTKPAQPDTPPADSLTDFRLRLADAAAGLEAAVTAQPDDWEPDGSEGVPVMDWSRAAPEDAPVFRSRHTAPLRPETPVVTAPADIPTFRHRDRIDAIPDQTDAHDNATRSAPAIDAAAPGILPEPGSEDLTDTSPRLDIEDDLAAYLGRDHMLDEGALRALIVEIVRQELQGSLGERITRNVRKLVRREIGRMLSSEEFE